MLKIVENHWAVGGSTPNPAGGAHSAPGPPAGGRGLAAHSPKIPPPLSVFGPSVLAPMKNLGRALGYLHQGGYVFTGVSFSLFVCLLCRNYRADFHQIRWKGGTRAAEETVRFWW